MILITGSLAYDQIMDFPGKFSDHILPDKLHILNVSFLVNKLRIGFGGTAGNIAYSLSLLGFPCAILGTVGTDFERYRKFLEGKEIETKYLKIYKSEFTSTAYGITDKKNNHIWGFHTGADKYSTSLSIQKVKEKIDFGVVAPNNPKAMLKIAGEYTDANIPFLFDPGMQLPWLKGEDLLQAFRSAKIIIGNDYEVQVIEKKTGIKNLHTLTKKGKIIITTLGDQGSIVSDALKTYRIKAAKPKKVIDPAGAGDAYRAGFLAGFLKGYSLQTCGQMAGVCSAYSVEQYGTTTHTFTIKDFMRRYEENFGKKIKL